MFLKKVFDDRNIVNEIYSSGKIKRYILFIIGVTMQALAFTLFIFPTNMVFGVSGISVILNKLFGINPSHMILLFNVVLIIASYVYLGREVTKYTVVGALLYPVLVELTGNISMDLGTTESVIIALTGAALYGLGTGLVFRVGYTTGGTDILKQIVSKYGKKTMGQATVYIEGVIVTTGILVFGWQSFIYSIMSIAVISAITDKVMLGTSEYKSFQIITNKAEEIRHFILHQLSRGVAIIDNKSSEKGHGKYLVFCTVPTKEYFILKEGINRIDDDARFIVTDTYEVNGLD